MAYRVQAQKNLCWRLKQDGLAVTAIAHKLNVHRGTVYNLLNAYSAELGLKKSNLGSVSTEHIASNSKTK